MDSIEKLSKDSNIENIMNSVANKYSRAIDRDEIESIKMITLWKCKDNTTQLKVQSLQLIYRLNRITLYDYSDNN